MSRHYSEVLGISAPHRKDLRTLFIAICRKNGVAFKSSSHRRLWDHCKRTLVLSDPYLKGRLILVDGEEHWMGEHKSAHPDAYALDALCQNFLCAKRKLDEAEVQNIMDSDRIAVYGTNIGSAAGVHGDGGSNAGPGTGHDVVSGVGPNDGPGVGPIAGSTDFGAGSGPVPVVGPIADSHAIHGPGANSNVAPGVGPSTGPAFDFGVGPSTGRAFDFGVGPSTGRAFDFGVGPSTGPAFDFGVGPGTSTDTTPTAFYGVGPPVGLSTGPPVPAGVGPSGDRGVDPGNGFHGDADQYQVEGAGGPFVMPPTTFQAQLNGPDATTSNGMVFAGHNGLGYSIWQTHPGMDELSRQAVLLKNTQNGLFVPYNCHPALFDSYTLDPVNADTLLHASYSNFLARQVNLCFVRVALSSAFPACHRLWMVYIPRVPTLRALKAYIHSHIRSGLLQRGPMPSEFVIAAVYIVRSDDQYQEVFTALDSDDAVFYHFDDNVEEQAMSVPGGIPLGAAYLSMVEVDLHPVGPRVVAYEPFGPILAAY